jgi:hypothetical protein
MPAEHPAVASAPAAPGRSAPPTGWREPALRLSVVFALGSFARLLCEIPTNASILVGIDIIAAGAFLAGLFAGWFGAAAFWAGEALVHLVLHGPTARFEYVVPLSILGCGAFAAFLRVPRVHRRLPDLRSYLTFAVAALVAAAPASMLTVALFFPRFSWSAVAVWYSAVVASIVLVVPAFLILCPRSIWRWRAPLPKEDALERQRTSGEAPRSSDSSSGWRLRPGRTMDRPIVVVGVVLAAIFAIHLSVVALGTSSPFTQWLLLLYSLPIFYAAYRAGLRGGLLASAAVGLSLLVSGRTAPGDLDWHFSTVELQAGLILFSLFGAVAGATRDRERNLARQLERSNRSLRQDLERVLAALRSAMEAKDQYTEGHLRRVCEFAVEVGRRLKLTPSELELLEIAALLHDVGKIGIADSVLRKPGPLDERERELMQRHPAIGARILENVEGLKEAAEMVRHHQERYDGRTSGSFPGYPLGLAGREIPLGARIIAVVDAFDAMTSDRPYRDSIGLERAKQTLRKESGSQFDPRVVETFLRLVEEREWERADSGEVAAAEEERSGTTG